VGKGVAGAGTAGATIAEEFVVITPPAYLYITDARPAEAPGQFEVPKAADCPGFNHYPYGLEKPNPYLIERELKPADVRANLARRRMAVVIGDDPIDRTPFDKSCPANLQGADRRKRAENVRDYIQLFPDWRDACRFATIDGPGPFTDAIYETQPEVRALLFDFSSVSGS
jgi:hypothetical protein